MTEAWVDRYIRKHPWRWRWALFLDWGEFWFWTWPLDKLIWDFKTFDEGRLRHSRTGRFLEADDPRHYGEIDDKGLED